MGGKREETDRRPSDPPAAVSRPCAGSSLTALLLAGGRSRRMGRNKALMEWQGVPLAVWVLRQVRPLCGRRLLVGGEQDVWDAVARREPDVEGIPDRRPGEGPLAGLEAGLAASRTDANLLLACDLPRLDPRVLLLLLEQWDPGRFDAVVPRLEGRWEPLQALYHRRLVEPARQALDAGRRSLQGFLELLRVREVTEADLAAARLPLDSFLNVNRPEDWRLLE